MQNDPGERIELADPWRTIEHRPGMGVTGLPTLHDTRAAEIDIFGVVLALELRGEQPHHMHPGWAAVARQLAYRLAVAFGLRQPRGELVNDMAQSMGLLLARDVTRDPTGVLHVLMPVQDFRHGGWLGAGRIPQMHGKDQRVLSRTVVEHGFGRRVR